MELLLERSGSLGFKIDEVFSFAGHRRHLILASKTIATRVFLFEIDRPYGYLI